MYLLEHLLGDLLLSLDELGLLFDIFGDLVEDDTFGRLSAHCQLVQALVELLKVPRLVQVNMRLPAFVDQVLEPAERLFAEFDLWGVGQVERLLIPVQIYKLQASGRAAKLD